MAVPTNDIARLRRLTKIGCSETSGNSGSFPEFKLKIPESYSM